MDEITNKMQEPFEVYILMATLASSFAENCKTIMENSTVNSDGSLTVPAEYVELMESNPYDRPEAFTKSLVDKREGYKRRAKMALNLIDPIKYNFK